MHVAASTVTSRRFALNPPRRARHAPRAGRQIHLAPLCACSARSARARPRSRIWRRAPTSRPRSPACARLGVDIDDAGPSAPRDRTAGAGPGCAAPPAPLDAGNSGHDACACCPGSWRAVRFATTITGDESLSPPADAPRHRPAHGHGRAHRRRPTAARRSTIDGGALHGHRRGARRSRAPRSRAPFCWPGSRPTGTTIVDEPLPTRDHTERAFPAFGLECRRRRHCRVRVQGGQEATAPAGAAARAGRSVLGGRLGGRGGGPAGLVRPNSRASASIRAGWASSGRSSAWARESRSNETGEVGGEPVGRLEVAHGGHGAARDRRRRRCPSLIDELPVLAARAALGGVARGLGRRRAARQGERPHHRARGRLARAGRRRRRAARRLRHRRVARGRRAAPPTRPATIGWSWRSRWSALGASGPTRHHRRRRRRGVLSRFRAGPGEAGRSDDRQDLPRRVHGERQEHDRARAGGAPALAVPKTSTI